ncbi:AraC family transcriptional regulator [Amycolatopsis pithecellobii]|uniref:Helix-turn-helix domain-containing protein n=1 Tax=Amycolatopsis pithecellobii TaxID=664692 RepID=A0A6N7Z2A6_9PSEU|nr:AraC family transcriptional regulator [Amycolatopsis pithecellobii]MTD55743.1 helix-turn-helix domain-containing protein [Amycolatopsis pithecellobii]
MDVLSDAIGAMRAGRPYSSLTAAEAAWTMEFPAFGGARFHVVTAGVCHVVRAAGPTVTLEPGDAVLFPHGTAHALQNAIDGESQLVCGAYQLDQARPHPLIEDLPELIHLPARADRYAGLESSITLLRDELADSEPGKDVLVPALLDVLLVHLIRAWFTERAGRQDTGWCVALGDKVIAPALRAIHEQPGDPWTVESLGARVGLSRAAFARRFASLVGLPPLTYLTWWRLTSAARLLRTTDAPLAAVAQRSGYGSAYAFANAFKREYGISAGQYRRQRRADHKHISEWTPKSTGLPRALIPETQ